MGVQGCHNGCWYANPQDHQRGDPPSSFDGQGGSNASYITSAFKPFVYVRKHSAVVCDI